MARIQIELPDSYLFSTRIQIYQSHINEAGHLDNAQLLTLVSEARKRFFHALGMQEIRVEKMIGIVVADAAVQYASEAFHGETLVCLACCGTSLAAYAARTAAGMTPAADYLIVGASRIVRCSQVRLQPALHER